MQKFVVQEFSLQSNPVNPETPESRLGRGIISGSWCLPLARNSERMKSNRRWAQRHGRGISGHRYKTETPELLRQIAVGMTAFDCLGYDSIA